MTTIPFHGIPRYLRLNWTVTEPTEIEQLKARVKRLHEENRDMREDLEDLDEWRDEAMALRKKNRVLDQESRRLMGDNCTLRKKLESMRRLKDIVQDEWIDWYHSVRNLLGLPHNDNVDGRGTYHAIGVVIDERAGWKLKAKIRQANIKTLEQRITKMVGAAANPPIRPFYSEAYLEAERTIKDMVTALPGEPEKGECVVGYCERVAAELGEARAFYQNIRLPLLEHIGTTDPGLLADELEERRCHAARMGKEIREYRDKLASAERKMQELHGTNETLQGIVAYERDKAQSKRDEEELARLGAESVKGWRKLYENMFSGADAIETLRRQLEEARNETKFENDRAEHFITVCDKLKKRVKALEKYDNRTTAAVERARPMCADHRDKFGGHPCLGCQIERLADDLRKIGKIVEAE